MAIDPTTTTTVKVSELASAGFNTSDLVPHEVGGYLKKGTLQDLATFIGGIISTDASVGFRAVTVTDGQTLPATTEEEFILVGPGTYPNVGGGSPVTTTEPLNALVSNGTYWFIGVEIPISASGAWGSISGTLDDQTDLQDALDLKADLVDGKVPSSQLPSYVDDVVEVANYAALPATGETGKIYITLDTNKVYRWSGSAYIEIAANSAVWGAITGTLSSQTDLNSALGLKVPYTGATGNVDLGSHKLTASDLVVNHTSGSGTAATISKGGNGEALTVTKSSGSGNVASFSGGVTSISELHLTTDLADSYIASAATWNAKQAALSGTGFVKIAGTTISYDNTTYLSGTVAIANGGTGATTASNALTNLGGTTVGKNIFTSTNPSPVTTAYLKVKPDNSVEWLEANAFRIAIGAGTGNGTVTSVEAVGSYGGLTLTGTVTGSGQITLGGTPEGTWPINVGGSSGSIRTSQANTSEEFFLTFVDSDNGSPQAEFLYTNSTIKVNALTGALTAGSFVKTGGTASQFLKANGTVDSTTYLSGTVAIANGGTGATTAAAARTNLGATTIGENIFTSTNPSAITFLRANADNTVSWLSQSDFRIAIGADLASTIYTSQATDNAEHYLSFVNSNNGSPQAEFIYTNSALKVNPSTGALTAGSFIKSGGTSSQYLMADGSVSTGGGGTVTSVAALTLGTTGTDLSSTVANGTTTPVITLNVPTASATNRGALSATDWTTFNSKQNALTNPVTGTGTTNYIPKFTGASAIGNSLMFDNGTNVGIGTATPPLKNSIQASTSGGNNSVTPLISLQDDRSDRYSSINVVRGAGSYDIGMSFSTVYETGGSASITERFRINPNGNVGIGLTAPLTKLHVDSDNTATDTVGNLFISTNNSQAANVGGQLTLGGFYNGGSRYAFGGIAGRKENATSGNVAGYLALMSTTSAGALTERMRITSGGNVGIGTSSPGEKLQVNGNILAVGNIYTTDSNVLNLGYNQGGGATLKYNSNGNLDITPRAGYNTVFTAGNVTVSSGTVTASGGFFNSDMRLKDLTEYDYNVSDIKPITYLWKDGRDNKKHVGYSAQEVKKVMPDAVNEDEKGFLSVNYVEVLVAKIAELENRIKQLEK